MDYKTKKIREQVRSILGETNSEYPSLTNRYFMIYDDVIVLIKNGKVGVKCSNDFKRKFILYIINVKCGRIKMTYDTLMNIIKVDKSFHKKMASYLSGRAKTINTKLTKKILTKVQQIHNAALNMGLEKFENRIWLKRAVPPELRLLGRSIRECKKEFPTFFNKYRYVILQPELYINHDIKRWARVFKYSTRKYVMSLCVKKIKSMQGHKIITAY